MVTTACADLLGLEAPTRRPAPVPCASGTVETRACGTCEREERTCTPRGWTEWSACACDGFRALAAPPAELSGRVYGAVVATDREVIFWGGQSDGALLRDGAAYDPKTNAWRMLPEAPISPRRDVAAVWTGDVVFIWGGKGDVEATINNVVLDDGALYDPRSNRWTHLDHKGAPQPRRWPGAVWSERTQRVLLWGGEELLLFLDDGASFDPITRTWASLPEAPLEGRRVPQAYLEVAGRMVVPFGYGCSDPDRFIIEQECSDGATYDPMTATWASFALPEKLSGRSDVLVRASRTRAFYFGGQSKGSVIHADGAVFTDAWSDLPAAPIPPAREQAAFVLGERLGIFGGRRGSALTADGALYDPQTGAFVALPAGGPSPRTLVNVAVVGPDAVFFSGGIGLRRGYVPDVTDRTAAIFRANR